MKYINVNVFLILFFVVLLVSCISVSPLKSPETGFCITGFVRLSASEPAVSETVMLFDSETGRLILSVETNLTGIYQFCGLAPDRYLVRAGDVSRRIVIRNRSERLDIILDECPICPERKP